MKKLVAIALALMLLLTSAAVAERAYVMNFSDPVLVMATGGEGFKVDLAGLTVTLAMGTSGETPTIELSADNGGETLLKGEMQIINGKLVMNLDGLSRPLSADMSASGPQAEEGIAALFANLESLMNFKLPAFTGVEIPKVDLISLGTSLGYGPATDASGNKTTTIDIPYEVVKSLLSTVGQYKSMIPESASAATDVVFDAIDQMVASDDGFALGIQLTDDGVTSAGIVDVYPVQGGVTAQAPVGGLQASFAQNQVNVAVVMYQGDSASALATVDVTSDPAAAELSFALDVMGMVSLTGSLYPDNGAQVAAISFSAGGESFNASLTYGEENGEDFADFAVEVPGQLALDSYTRSTPTANGNTGSAVLTVNVQSEPAVDVELSGSIDEAMAEYAFTDIANASSAIDVATMSEADEQQLSAELNDVLSGLLNYVATLDMQPAA